MQNAALVNSIKKDQVVPRFFPSIFFSLSFFSNFVFVMLEWSRDKLYFSNKHGGGWY